MILIVLVKKSGTVSDAGSKITKGKDITDIASSGEVVPGVSIRTPAQALMA